MGELAVDRNLIPPEVWFHVLDHLWDDVHALFACSLTYSAWVRATRLHLFNMVVLQCDSRDLVFEQLIGASPYIASSVRRLAIQKPPRYAYTVTVEIIISVNLYGH